MLTQKNKRIIRKMMHYIRTFPLLESEIQKIKQDLTGMALEAQKRGESFEEILDMKPDEFCDELINSIGGNQSPGGRRLLKGVGIYYQLTGLLGTALLSLAFLISLFLTIVVPSELAFEGVIILLAAGTGLIFFLSFLSFGNMAERYCNTTSRSVQLVSRGKVLLIVAVLLDVAATFYIIVSTSVSLHQLNYALLGLTQVIAFFFCYIPAILYIIGAKRNLPQEYALN